MAPLFVEDPSERLNHPSNAIAILPRIEHKMMYSAGVHKELPRVPEFIKPLIASCAQFEKQKDVAAAFGVSQPTVSALANGFDNVNEQRNGNQNPELLLLTSRKVNEVRDTALERLQESLNLMGDKLPDAGIKELSQVANVTSSVIERTLPKNQAQNVIGQVILYMPKQADLNSFGAPIEVEGQRID